MNTNKLEVQSAEQLAERMLAEPAPIIEAPKTPTVKRTRLKPVEHTAIGAMVAAGTPVPRIAESLGRSPNAIRRYIADARELLDSAAADYVAIHRKAAETAAEKGDARPAEWMLERTGVVKPESKTPESKGFTVKIGVILPGLGATSTLGLQAGEPDNSFIDAELDDSAKA